jgi:GT2 family glycosyltransferase
MALLGMMSKMPVAGVVWQTVHYLVGFRRLGFDVHYVEDHGTTPKVFFDTQADDGWTKAAGFIDDVMRRFGFGDRWCFRARYDGRCFGLSETRLKRLYSSADLLVNLHGGTIPLPEHAATGRLIYVETDPVEVQIQLHENRQDCIDFLEPHVAFFTYAENYGSPDSRLPVSSLFEFKPTRQPVVLDFWKDRDRDPGTAFTTIGNWLQPHRRVKLDEEVYTWSKHVEFLKFLDLPKRTGQPFELALSSYAEADRQLLEENGWRVHHALDLSTDIDTYRDYIAGSRGEWTVAKDQNIRLRTGWFSDRSATYLAAGRPVITQDTGFGNVLPTGEGLFAFSTTDDVVGAIDAIALDYACQSAAAKEIAVEYFDAERVLSDLLGEVDLTPAPRGRPVRASMEAFPRSLVLTPMRRHPTHLPPATEDFVLKRPIPSPPSSEAVAESPHATIIVPIFDQLVFTRLCLESVLESTDKPAFELIVVDNASTQTTRDYLDRLAALRPNVHVISNSENLGFAAAINRGVAAARGAILVLLNNDTIVVPGWLERLTAHLDDRRIGLVGAHANRAGNEAEIATCYTTYGGLLDFAATWPGMGPLRDVRTVAMFCAAMHCRTFNRVGELDEAFGLGLFEDDDYAMRVRAAGLRVTLAPDVFVHHFGETTVRSTGDYGALFHENCERFERKWQVSWQSHDKNASLEYGQLVKRVLSRSCAQIPPAATVLVVSKGDDRLLNLGEREAWHFPRNANGKWSGYYPFDSSAAIGHLEELRSAGARFMILPKTAFWWLEHYRGFAEHLQMHYRQIAGDDEACVIFDLETRAIGQGDR